MRVGLFAILLALAAAACAKPQAKTEPEMPPLEAPVPPPRLIAPLDLEPVAPLPAPADETPARGPSRSAARSGARTETAKPADTAKVEPPKSETPPEAARPPDAGAPVLRTVQPVSDAELERSIRDDLAKAARDLNRVDYGALSVDAKAQYDTAKRFAQQASEALKAKNFVFASNLADKAATLAQLLLGR